MYMHVYFVKVKGLKYHTPGLFLSSVNAYLSAFSFQTKKKEEEQRVETTWVVKREWALPYIFGNVTSNFAEKVPRL